MFHRSTAEANKDHVLNTFPKRNSTIRLLIATVAFGMEINIPHIRIVINYGAPSTIEAFFKSLEELTEMLNQHSVLYCTMDTPYAKD